MKFIVDAHLPLLLCSFLEEQNHNAIHTRNLPLQNETTDEEINLISISEKRILITKDSDFYYSYLIKKMPYKLILLRVGNCSKVELVELFKHNFQQIEKHLESCGMIEIYKNQIEITD
jgi:predicted nuclease of predicted toxin-antitoxin system